MGYLKTEYAKKETPLKLVVRGKEIPATATSAVFVPHNYKR